MSRFSAVLAALVIGAAVIYSLIGNPLDPFDNRSFAPSAWRVGSPEARARMARSAAHRIAPGLPESEVVTLLGKPDEVRTEHDAGGKRLQGMTTYSYDLGSWSRYGYDDAFLYVHLDDNNRVIAAEATGY